MLKQIGLSFNGTRVASWTDERIERHLESYAAEIPNYAQAYIAYITPLQFLSLTTGDKPITVDRIMSESENYKSLNQDTINYVVQAVPDAKRKILYINSAYKNKKEVNHLPDALSPNETSDNDGELSSFDGDSIPLSEDVVKNSLKDGMSKREIALAEQVEFWKQEATKDVTVITKQAAIVLINEVSKVSTNTGNEKNSHSHDWLDNYGKNDWEYWTVYLQEKNNTIWSATLNVTTDTNGRKVLYDISNIKKVGQAVVSATFPTETNSIITEGISQEDNQKVSRKDNTRFSPREQLLQEQVEFWKQEATKEVTVITKQAVMEIAKDVMSDYHGKLTREEVAQRITKIREDLLHVST